MSLRFIPGAGRLMRNERYIAFWTAPCEELSRLLTNDETSRTHHELFRQLGSAVITSGFHLPPFMVVALGPKPHVFAYGDLKLSGGETHDPIKSTSSYTWVERALTPTETNLLTIDNDSSSSFNEYSDCYLTAGMVPAGNFRWSLAIDLNQTVDQPTMTKTEPAPVRVPAGTVSSRLATHSNGLPIGESPAPRPEPERPGSGLSMVSRIDRADAAARIAGNGNATNGTTKPSPTARSTNPEADRIKPPDVDQPATNGDSDPPWSLDDEARRADLLRTRQIGEPPTISASTASQVASAVLMDPPKDQTTIGVLVMDDGEILNLTRSVYVGRYPSKFGLPPGYGAVLINSEHVSRIHWELLYDGTGFSVADLGSSTGTWIQGPDDPKPTRLVSGQVTEIQDGTTIRFGDLSATFHSTNL